MRYGRIIRCMVALAALSTLSLVLFLGVGPHASAKSPMKAHQPPSHGGKPPSSSSGIGSPAIPVKPGMLLTVDDVRAYVTKHPFEKGRPQTIVSIRETTYGQVGDLYTHYLNAPTAQEPVFSVILRGPFVFDFSGPSSASSSTLTANDGGEVFDANTGNRLEWGYIGECGTTSSGGGTPISIPLIGTPTVTPPPATPLPC